MVFARNDPLDNVTVFRKSIAGQSLRFSNMMGRAFLRDQGLVGCAVAFCKGCHEVFSEQILGNYSRWRG